MSAIRLFAYRLALATGELDVSRVLAMPASALHGWIAYASVEPIGYGRTQEAQRKADWRLGFALAAIVNFFRGKGARVKPADYLIEWSGEPARQQSNREIALVFELAARAAAGAGNGTSRIT